MFFLPQKLSDRHWGPANLLFSGHGGSFKRLKLLGPEVNHSSPYSTEVKKEWSNLVIPYSRLLTSPSHLTSLPIYVRIIFRNSFRTVFLDVTLLGPYVTGVLKFSYMWGWSVIPSATCRSLSKTRKAWKFHVAWEVSEHDNGKESKPRELRLRRGKAFCDPDIRLSTVSLAVFHFALECYAT